MASKKRSKRDRSKKKHVNRKYQKLEQRTRSLFEKSGVSTENIRFYEPSSGELKMSAVILELVDPLIEKHGNTDKRIKTIISIAIIVWNISVIPQKEPQLLHEQLYNEVIDRLAPEGGTFEDIKVLKYLIYTVLERKKKYFPDIKKMIIDYELSISDGSINLNVVSSPIKPD